jgi:hypothetical protein
MLVLALFAGLALAAAAFVSAACKVASEINDDERDLDAFWHEEGEG